MYWLTLCDPGNDEPMASVKKHHLLLFRLSPIHEENLTLEGTKKKKLHEGMKGGGVNRAPLYFQKYLTD